MKRKSKLCSTGHGTGVTPPVELRTILGRKRMGVRRVWLGVLGSVDRPRRRFGWAFRKRQPK